MGKGMFINQKGKNYGGVKAPLKFFPSALCLLQLIFSLMHFYLKTFS
jgi:hypothetical protein